MENESSKVPRINVGEYAGTPIDQLPLSYCRWMLGQDFPAEWVEIARRKVKASPSHDDKMILSKHALDQFSTRFLKHWTEHKYTQGIERHDGLATFLVKRAREAWDFGEDVSKGRHKNDGIVKACRGIKYVFSSTAKSLELITVM